MKKRIFALLMAFVMLLGVLPVGAFAAEAAPITGAYLDSAGQQALTVTQAEENLTWNHYGSNMSLPLFRVTVPAGTEYIYVSYAAGVTVQNVADYYKDGGLVQGQMNMPEKSPMLKMPMADVLGTGKIALLYGADWSWIAAVEFQEGGCAHTWNDATCSAPKTCSKCGATEGEVGDHKYTDGTCEHCGAAEPVSNAYTLKLSDARELTAGLNYFISIPAEGMDIIFDFGNGTISGAMCQRHCSKKNFWTAGEGSTLVVTAENVAAHLCDESERAEIAEDFDLELTDGSQMFAFYWWTTANTNGSYIYIEILSNVEPCDHTWNEATCSAPKICSQCGATEGEKNPQKHKFEDGACIYCGNTDGAPIPFSQKISVPANGDSTWGNISGLTLSGTDGSIYEAYWSDTSNPYVLDVILGQDTDLDATITAEFSRGGSVGDSYKPTISGTLTVTLVDGKGTITMHAQAWNNAVFYPHTDWTINLTVDDGSAANRPTYAVELPTETEGYTVSAHNSESPVIEGRAFSFKVTIDGEYKKGENFKVLVNGEELTSSGDTYTITNITEKQVVTVEGVEPKTLADKNVTVIVPAGATVSSGYHYSYFKYDFCEPLEETVLADGRIQKVFKPQSGRQGFIRVQHPDGVTYWDFDGLTAGKVIEVTEEMLFIGSSEFNKETVYANFEKNNKDKADLYLTANEKGWLDMQTGDTWNLNVFRNFLSLGNTVSNDCLALPDVEYKVVSVNGGSSDVISVTPNENNSSYAEIKAEKPGTAIILVSYDAVYNADGEGGKQWSAIWPENTGVIVVTVDGATGGITTNMTVNEEANSTGKQVIDAEHDILFYVGNSGASYSFKPEAGCAVTVNRSSVGSTMTFGGFSGSGVEVADDGTVTVSGLTTGTHIIKVEKDGKTVYQVIRARQVTYEVLDSTNAVVNAENPAEPGEKITVQFHGLVSPMEKLSGVYNANFGFWYNGEDGTEIRTSGGTYGVYNFSGSPGAQKFSFTLPATWSEDTYTLTDGAIKIGGFGSSAGAHRTTTYIEGKEVNTNASGVAGVLAVLPEIQFPVNAESGADIDESIREDIFDSATDGTGWGRDAQAYVDKLTLVGAQVQSTRWDGDTCYVELVPETATDADIGFTISYAAPDMPTWINNLSGTFNGEAMTAGELMAGKLVDGTYTAEVYVIYGSITKYSGTKTFQISIGEEIQNIPVESVNLDKTSAELEIGQTLTLTATVKPDNATDKTVTWTSSNEAVATVENGVVTAVAAGDAVITAKAGDKEATCTVTVKAAEPKEGIDIVTGEVVGSSTDIRVSNIHIGAAGEVVSNTISTDGKVTVQLAEDVEKLEITLSMFANKGMVLKKGAVAFNNGTPEELENVDQDNNLAIWTTEVTPVWTDGEMEIPFTVGMRTSTSWKTERNYTLTLKKAEDTSGGAVAVESVTLDKTSAQLEIGQTLTLTATVKPDNAADKTVTWTSSDEAVATVENGVVTAVAAGDAVITAKAGDKEATCAVTVKAAAEPKEGIDIVTGEAVSSNFDIRVSNIHVGAAGEVISNTVSTDGKVTVQLAEDVEKLEITLSMFAKKGMVLTKGAVAFNNGTPEELENVDQDNNLAIWTTEVTPVWTDGEMEIPFTVGVRTSSGWKTENHYTLTLKKAEDTSGGAVAVESVTLDKTSAQLEIGQTLTLTATVDPDNATDKTVTWTSSDEAVATVKDGKITAVSTGVTVITVTTADGGKTASCIVGVKKPAEPEFGIPANEIAGYVTVSFEDYGVRVEGESMDPAYADPRGVIVPATRVPFKANDTVAAVTLRLLQAKGMTATYTGSATSGFYLSSVNGFGEFDAGSGSGWMITLNGWFINKGASEFQVKDGDVVKWQYTCQLGADIGDTGFYDSITDVINLINAIGTVTEDSGDQIKAAREAYDKLSDADKKRVSNYAKLTDAEAAYEAMLNEDVKQVEELIDAIGTVTMDSKDKIEAARKAYDALPTVQKQKVSNYAELTDAEAKLAQLQKEEDKKAAKQVEDLIAKLDKNAVTFEADVKAAKEAYDALTADQKKLVTNYAKLTDALKALADEKDIEAAETVEKLIDAIGTVTKDSEDKIQAAREAYDKLTDEQKALVENIAALEAAEEKLAKLKEATACLDIYNTTGDYLEKLGTPVPGSVGGEWMVIGLLRSDRKVEDMDAYYDAAVKYVQDNIDENGRLHRAKSTENARMILALTAMGKDVTNVGGHNLLTGLNTMEYVQKQGINGPIWALIALDSGNYPAPAGDVTRESLIQVILDAQLADGGWALSGSTSDPDMTGMALQALAPYCNTNAEVKKAVDAALITLSDLQAEDGSFGSIDGTSSESVAQVIAALSALGIDADTDPRFVKNGVSALDALCAFFVEGGGFKHVPDGKLDGMATEQSYYALAAYFRMLSGKTALFNMTDVVDMGGDPVVEVPVETEPTETEPVPTEPVETPAKDGRSFPWWLVIVIVVLAGGIVVLAIVSKSKKRR